MVGSVRTLDGFHIQVYSAIFLPNGGISTVGQRTTATIAQASNIVLVSTEVEGLGLGFEAAMVVIYNLQDISGVSSCTVKRLTNPIANRVNYLPYNFVVLHTKVFVLCAVKLRRSIAKDCRSCCHTCERIFADERSRLKRLLRAVPP